MAERQEAMDEEEYKTMFRLAFGESSSDSDEEDEQLYDPPTEIEDSKINGAAGIQEIQSIFGDQNNCWERFSEIKGLSLCRDFLTPDQQSSLLSAIHQEGWCVEASHNQAMRFGDLPAWANALSIFIREAVYFGDDYSDSLGRLSCDTDRDTCLFPLELLFREPLFNQLIINSYQPGEGICAHVDLMRFEDGIALISLESSCLMHFSRIENEACGGVQETSGDSPLLKVPVYLTPGSLLLMWGEARYNWKHEINRKPGFQIWEGREIDQKRRTSITLRKLSQSV